MPASSLLNNSQLFTTTRQHQYAGSSITETLTNGFFTVDKQWTVKYWNKAAEKILGVKAEDITGRNLWDKFAGILPLEFYAVYQKAFTQRLPVHFEEYWGEMGAWFEVITYYCEDTLSVSFKSSNHPHAEYPENPVQRLKNLTELYRFVTEITNDALWEWNFATEEIFWIDGGHKRVFGYQVENALIPLAFWESCIHPSDRKRILGTLQQLLTTASSNLWEDEYRFAKADGSYAYVHDRGHIIYENGKALRMIGATQDISARVILQQQLEESRLGKHRNDTAAIITAQEKIRSDVGAQLLNNFSQMLAAINIYLQIGRKNIPENIYLERCSEYINGLSDEVKKFYQTLRAPDKLLGLFESIEIMVNETVKDHDLVIDLNTNGIDEHIISKKLQLAIYRIVQEQLQNVIRHSSATEVVIYMNIKNDVLRLYVIDNGHGWKYVEKRTGLGLTNIIICVEMLQGSASIISTPKEGFVLKVLLPLSSSWNSGDK